MQVQLYIPETNTAAFGVVRAIAKDSTDNGTTPSAFSFLDTNGLVGWVNSSQAAKTSSNFQVGQMLQGRGWMMLTLTTHPEGGKGFQLWINGGLAAEEVANGTYQSTACFLLLESHPEHALVLRCWCLRCHVCKSRSCEFLVPC